MLAEAKMLHSVDAHFKDTTCHHVVNHCQKSRQLQRKDL